MTPPPTISITMLDSVESSFRCLTTSSKINNIEMNRNTMQQTSKP